ncbi:MAG: hypothetical protein ACM359_13895 [Bacillota bacterium]
MENEVAEKVPEHVASATRNSPDLSAEIVRAVSKQRGDIVKCRRISTSMYRCNWFEPEPVDTKADAQRFLSSYRIRDSKFLRVTKVDGQLMIEDITGQTACNN